MTTILWIRSTSIWGLLKPWMLIKIWTPTRRSLSMSLCFCNPVCMNIKKSIRIRVLTSASSTPRSRRLLKMKTLANIIVVSLRVTDWSSILRSRLNQWTSTSSWATLHSPLCRTPCKWTSSSTLPRTLSSQYLEWHSLPPPIIKRSQPLSFLWKRRLPN